MTIINKFSKNLSVCACASLFLSTLTPVNSFEQVPGILSGTMGQLKTEQERKEWEKRHRRHEGWYKEHPGMHHRHHKHEEWQHGHPHHRHHKHEKWQHHKHPERHHPHHEHGRYPY